MALPSPRPVYLLLRAEKTPGLRARKALEKFTTIHARNPDVT